LLGMTTAVAGPLCWRDFHPLERQLDSLHHKYEPDMDSNRSAMIRMRTRNSVSTFGPRTDAYLGEAASSVPPGRTAKAATDRPKMTKESPSARMFPIATVQWPNPPAVTHRTGKRNPTNEIEAVTSLCVGNPRQRPLGHS
jgi:hypothetical protein